MAECLPDIGEALGSIPSSPCPLFSFEDIDNAHISVFCLVGDSVSILVTWRLKEAGESRQRKTDLIRHIGTPSTRRPGPIFS